MLAVTSIYHKVSLWNKCLLGQISSVVIKTSKMDESSVPFKSTLKRVLRHLSYYAGPDKVDRWKGGWVEAVDRSDKQTIAREGKKRKEVIRG